MYGMIDKDRTVIDGINSRLDELQAAILKVKLKYLDKMNRDRSTVANRYIKSLSPDLFAYQQIPNKVFSNNHVFVPCFLGDRNKLIQHLDKNNIQTNIYYLVPHHLQEGLRHLGYKKGDLPIVEKVCSQAIALPMYPELSVSSQNKVISAINKFK